MALANPPSSAAFETAPDLTALVDELVDLHAGGIDGPLSDEFYHKGALYRVTVERLPD